MYVGRTKIWVSIAIVIALLASFQAASLNYDGSPVSKSEPDDSPYGEVQCDIIGSTRAHSLGYTGTGILIGEAGTGLDTGDNATLFTDFAGRVEFWVDWTEADTADGTGEDGYGLSTPFVSWMAGDASSGQTDSNDGKLLGQGVAPGASLLTEKVFSDTATWFGGDMANVFRDASQKGAFGLSNSWGGGTNYEYGSNCFKIDTAVRDADSTAPGYQQLLLTLPAGNFDLSGSACNKNGISVGVSENYKPFKSTDADDIEQMWGTSGTGPTADGRVKPDLVVPATWGTGVRSHDPGAVYTGNEAINTDYLYATGTGGAAAIVNGGAAVFAEYYLTDKGAMPSPAMAKAALINGATDMDDASGTTPIPNDEEGWGRVNLTNVIEPSFDVFYDDQSVNLTTGGFETYDTLFVNDASQPFKITVVWTDVPAPDTTGAGQALINDLDLIVSSPGGTEYHGNQFTSGWSDGTLTGYDTVNNVECVYVQNPELGQWTIIVNGTNVQQDALAHTGDIDQDYAMVVTGLFDRGNPYNITIPDPTGPWPAWRFVSFPIEISGPIEEVLDDSLHAWGDGGFTWDIAQWYDSGTGRWHSYNTNFVGTQELTDIDNTMGVWLHITENTGDQYLTTGYGGAYPSVKSVPLSVGWNLVGYPSATPEWADVTLPIEVTKIAVYNATRPYDIEEVALSTVMMKEGNAYWLYATAATTWTVNP